MSTVLNLLRLLSVSSVGRPLRPEPCYWMPALLFPARPGIFASVIDNDGAQQHRGLKAATEKRYPLAGILPGNRGWTIPQLMAATEKVQASPHRHLPHPVSTS